MKLPVRASTLAALAFCGTAATVVQAAPLDAVEYYHPGMNHYFMTAFPQEIAALDAGQFGGWQRTGLTFRVKETPEGLPSQQLRPVCRYFSDSFAPRSSHFYSALTEECQLLAANPLWRYEAEAFWVSTPASGSCGNDAAVTRFYNNGEGGAPNHRYAANQATVDAMTAAKWVREGPVFCSEGVVEGRFSQTDAHIDPLARLLGGEWDFAYDQPQSPGSTLQPFYFRSIRTSSGGIFRATGHGGGHDSALYGGGPARAFATLGEQPGEYVMRMQIWGYNNMCSVTTFRFTFSDDNTIRGTGESSGLVSGDKCMVDYDGTYEYSSNVQAFTGTRQ